MDLLKRLSRRLAVIEAILAAGLLAAVFLVDFSQVLMRYLIACPNPWSEELSRFCFIWLSVLGAALAECLVGHLPGGMGQAVVLSEVFFSGVSGSTSADAAAIGGIMIPQLTASGHSRERSTSIVSAACAMGILIPPAIVMVVYGVIGNVSIGRLFVACIPPAVLIATGLMVQIGWQARRQGWPRTERASWRRTGRVASEGSLALCMIVVILGGIRLGWFTPTEAAAVAVAYSLVVSTWVYGELSRRHLMNSLVQTAVVSGMVLLVVGAARLLTWVFAVAQVPEALASAAVQMAGGPEVFMILTVLIFLPLGAILDGVPAVVLLTPMLLPLAKQLGIDPVHYGVVIVATQGVSVFLPPVGVSLLVACSVGHVEPTAVGRHLWPYLALMLGFTLLIALTPGLALFLPRLVGYWLAVGNAGESGSENTGIHLVRDSLPLSTKRVLS